MMLGWLQKNEPLLAGYQSTKIIRSTKKNVRYHRVVLEGVGMSDEQEDPSIKKIPVRDLKIEPESEDLLDSPAMKPYLNLMMAMMQGKDTGPAIEELTALPLERRYTWRVASALKWAFGDLETMNVEADR